MTNMHRRTFLAAAGTAVLAPALPLTASSGSSPAPVLLTGYFLQESDDLNQSFEALIAGDEAAINSHNQHHDAEAAGPGSDDAIVSRNVFKSCAGKPGARLPSSNANSPPAVW
jgi:hypothetical protein